MTPAAFMHLKPEEKKTMAPPLPVTTTAHAAPAVSAPPAPAAAAVPMQITVAPTQASHWLTVLSIISAVMQAETPLLLQILPPKAATGVAVGDVGLAALVAGITAEQLPSAG